MAKRRTRAETWAHLRRFYSYLTPHAVVLSFIFVLLVAFAVLQLVMPILVGKVIDLAAAKTDWHRIVVLLLWFAAILAVRTVILIVRNYLLQQVGMKITCTIRVAVFAHLQSLSLRFYEARHTGKIVARVTDDTGAVYNLVTGASVNLIGDLITILVIMVFLLRQNLQLTLVTYAILPFFVFNYLWHRRRMRYESRAHRRHWDKLIGFLHERIASTRLVRSFATEDFELASFQGDVRTDQAHFNRVVWRNTLLGAGAELIAGVGTLAILAYGAWLAFHNVGGFTVGALVTFYIYLGFLFTPIIRLVDANALIQRAVTALEKIFVLLDTQPHVPDDARKPALPPSAGRVEFQDVSFSYRPREAVVKEISFVAEPGKMTALVGPSGSGKTTVISLLARFYDPVEGRILIDGIDIAGCNTTSVRRQIGIVMQDNVLFSGSIAENLKYGRREATDAEMVEAAQAANAHEFIDRLPRGYESRVGERGVQLSGGQRQRLAIARVLLKNPRILIFDEATSALDTHSERLIQQATERVLENRTAFVIAHRLSTVLNADQILVMKEGRIVERGTHSSLLVHGGLYRELHDLQFAPASR